MNRASPHGSAFWIALSALTVVAALPAANPPVAFAAGKTAAGSAGKSPAFAGPSIPVEEHVLSNGMRILFIPQHVSPTISGAWLAHVGSVNERPGITGISHLFEHMMFKGTHVIGTHDYATDVRLIDEQEQVQDSMRAEMSSMRGAARRGDIDDITKPEAKTPRYRELEARFDSLVAQQRRNMVKNQFDNELQENGGSFINAFTTEDFTCYFETLPANKLELWFWMEADRIHNRVFREFYSERDVVYEERRRSIESTPTGPFEVAYDATFWESSPYHWPVIGWPSDVAAISKKEADDYYATYYAPQNLTAFLVGDFDPKEALRLAELYFGSIPAGTSAPPEMITSENHQLAEKRLYAEAETNPGVWVRWHTPAYVHKDVPALNVLAEIMNGPTGRLRKHLILGSGIATDADASQTPHRYEGMFQINAECKEGHSPEEVERAIYAELDSLRKTPVSDEELQKVKNRFLTSSYRQIGSNMQLLFRYGLAEGLGSWRDADRIEQAVQTVTAADVQRVVSTYFTKENRTVAIWTRAAGSAPEDPALAALPPEAKPMAMAALGRIKDAKDPAQLQRMLEHLDQMGGQVPPEMKPAIDFIRAKARARLAELESTK